MMTLPRWNDEWEKPDLLRGKRGWTFPDYINIGVAIVLVVTTFSFFLPAVLKIQEAEFRIRRLNEWREQEFANAWNAMQRY